MKTQTVVKKDKKKKKNSKNELKGNGKIIESDGKTDEKLTLEHNDIKEENEPTKVESKDNIILEEYQLSLGKTVLAIYSFSKAQYSSNDLQLIALKQDNSTSTQEFEQTSFSYTNPIDKRKIRLYKAHYYFNDDSARFKMSLKKHIMLLSDPIYYEKDERIRILPDENFAFIFDLMFAPCSSFLNKQPAGVPVKDPLIHLICYSYYLLDQSDWIQTIPILARQFFSFYRILNATKDSSLEAIKLINTAITYIDPNKIDERSSYAILSLLGCLPHSIHSYQIAKIDSIDSFFNIFGNSILYTLEELKNSQLYPAVTGLVHMMIFSKISKKDDWKIFLAQIKNTEIKEEVIDKFIENSKSHLNLDFNDCEILFEIIGNLEVKKFIDYSLKIAFLCQNFSDFTVLLKTIIYKREEDINLGEWFNKYWSQNELITFINKYISKMCILNTEEISKTLEVLHTMPYAFKILFYESNLRNSINAKLKDPYPITDSTLIALKSIYRDYFDAQLIDALTAPYACSFIIKQKTCLFSDIFQSFEFDEEIWKEKFNEWLITLLPFEINNYRDKIDIFDLEILRMPNNEKDKKYFCKEFINLLGVRSQNKRISLLNYISEFNRCQSIILKDAYSNYCYQNVLNNKDKDQIKTLESYQVNEKDNGLVTAFLSYKIAITEGDNVSENTIEEHLYCNPSPNHFWCLLINLFDNFQNVQYVTSLVNAIAESAENIVQGKVKIKNLLAIKKYSDDQKEAFNFYIRRCLQIKNRENIDFFENLENNVFPNLDVIIVYINVLRTYIDVVCNDVEDRDNLETLYSNSTQNYLEVDIADFGFQEDLVALLDIIRAIVPVINSSIYLNYYLALEKEKEQSLTSQNIGEISKIAYESMKNDFNEIMDDIKKYSAAKIIEIFEKVNDYEKELVLINSIFTPDKETIDYFGWCLYFIKNKNNYLKACESLLKLQDTIDFSDQVYIKICTKFTNFIQKIKKRSVASFFKFSENVRTNLFMYIDQEREDKLISALDDLSKSEDLIKFASRVKENELEQLKESVNDYDDTYVTTQVILDFEFLWYFFKEIANTAHSYQKMAPFILSKIDSKEGKLKEKFSNCIINLQGIKELHNVLNCREEAKQKQIIGIVKKSAFEIISVGEESYDVNLLYEKNDKQAFNLANLLELRDRSMLLIHTKTHSEQEENGDTDMTYYTNFIEYSLSIQNILATLKNLDVYGYPNSQSPQKVFSCIDGEYDEVKQFEKNLNEIFSNWERDLTSHYKSNYYLSFMNGKQLWTLEKYIILKDQTYRRKAENLLTFMGKQSFMANIENYSDNKDVRHRLQLLATILDEIPNLEDMKMDKEYDIAPRSAISQNNGEILYIETSKLINAVISAYINSRHALPRADQVFFCQYTTHWKDLLAFFHRCFLNKNGELYLLINCENLSLENQNKAKALFTELIFERVGELQFKFGIITSDPRSSLSSYFKYLDSTRVINLRESQILIDEKLRLIMHLEDKNSIVYTSASAGLGKTAAIRSRAKNEVKDLVTFPISGDVDCIDISNRFSNINLNEDCILHLQLSFVSNAALLNEILMNICLFRTLNCTEDIIIFPKDMLICIEVANTYDNMLYNSIDYLKYLKCVPINGLDLNELIVDNHSFKLQFVARYLHLYETGRIEDQTVNESDLHDTNKESIVTLLERYFIDRQNDKEQITYTQISVFINILDRLLRNFTRSPFNPEIIREIINDLRYNNLEFFIEDFTTFRATIIDALLLTTEEFTTKSIKSVRKSQFKASQNLWKNEEIQDGQEDLANAFQCTLTWENSNHFTMVFLEDGSFVPIYRDKDQVPESIKKLIFWQHNFNRPGEEIANLIESQEYEIDDYANMSHNALLQKLQTYNKHGKDLAIEYSDSHYVMTPDNFLKMNLIYLRIQSNIPVIIMGETGCGKTSLIQFFVEEVLGNQLIKISIHAGITSKQIKERMAELIEKAYNMSYENADEKLWVFFDEFNTTDSIGLICEIMCERSIEGDHLPDNIAFLGACNPYRVSSKKAVYEENVGIKKANAKISKLMHVVKPLPDTMIEYVWDFGYLTENDSRKYIHTMLKTRINTNYHDLFVYLICLSHKYFQSKEDVSSVSLRDVTRFIMLYLWFRESIQSKHKLRGDLFYENLKKYDLIVEDQVADEDFDLNAGILAFSHCYYLRISSQRERNEFLEAIVNELDAECLTVEKILKIVEEEQNDYLARMEITKGTALNQALRENIFAVIPCIVNKIPIFICGKPGCSKSLSIQLIFANLRGEKSTDPYFKTLPELALVPFQGSDSCTSEGILKAFERSKKFLNSDSNLLPVIVFDEIGLAEISKHNPLKVLHSLLEIENNIVGFIGISNWRLDASKMNRALYLARPDPDEEDLIHTAMSIYTSYSDGLRIYESVISSLAKSYFLLKNEYKNTEFTDFYGLRDFYHLIKQVSKNLVNRNILENQEISMTVKQGIERNFGGKLGSSKKMGEFFATIHHFEHIYPYLPEINVLDLINDNLSDSSSRYLMLIGRVDVITYIIDKHLNSLAERRIIVGSKLKNDTDQEEYSFRSLSDIILYMERGISIILKDMDHIYSSLYDLFNQNFAVSGEGEGERRYCRIALGALFNPRCFVHSNFHAIVFMNDDENNLLKADAPFLNRFEKHYLSLESMLNEEQAGILVELENWVNSIFSYQDDSDLIFTKNHIFPIYNRETLALQILFDDSKNKEQVLSDCKKTLLKIAPADILILLNLNSLDQEEKSFINNHWREFHSQKFPEVLNSMIENQAPFDKLIAFTYDNRSANQIQEIKRDEIVINEISNFGSEREITKDIETFYYSETKSLYILELDFSKDINHLSLIKFIIDREEKETKNDWKCRKLVCVIIHMTRNIKHDSSVILFGSWEIRMFDDLSMETLEISDELLNKTTKELIFENQIVNFEENIGSLVENCILRFKYEQTIYANKEKLNTYLLDIIDKVAKDKILIEALKEKSFNLIRQKPRIKDWKIEIFYNSELVSDSNRLFTAITSAISREIESALTILIYLLEEKSALLSYFSEKDQEYSEEKRNIWFSIFKTMKTGNIALQNVNQGNILKLEFELHFPFSKPEYRTIIEFYKVYKVNKKNKDALEVFIESYREKSVYKDNLAMIEQNEYLQNVFIKDMIRICLARNLMSMEYEFVVFSLFSSSVKYIESFEEKLISFMNFENLLVLLCQIFSTSLISAENLLGMINNSLQAENEEYKLGEYAESEEDSRSESEASEESLESSVENDFNESLIQLITHILKVLTKEMMPKFETLAVDKNGLNYPIRVEKLYNLLAEAELIGNFELENLDELEFWVSFSSLVAKSKIDQLILLEIHEVGKFYAENNDSYIYNQSFVDYVFEKINADDKFQEQANENDLAAFKASYMKLLLNQNAEYILNIAGEFENSEIWKYSTKLITIALKKSGLIGAISEISKRIGEGENPDFEIGENPYLNTIERILSEIRLDCKFAVLLSDTIYKFIKDEEQEEPNEESKEADNHHDQTDFYKELLISKAPVAGFFNNYLTDDSGNFSNIRKLISAVQIRIYLEIYSMLLLENSTNFEPELRYAMGNVNQFLCESQYGETFRLFCLKNIFYHNQFTIDDLSKFLKAKRGVEWINRIGQLQVENKLEIIPYIPNLKKHYIETVAILNGIIQGQNFYGELSAKILASELSHLRLALGLAFMNEVFTLFTLNEQINDNLARWLESSKEIVVEALGDEFYSLLFNFLHNFPRNSILHLSVGQNQKEVHQSLLICMILITLFAYKDSASPLTSIFFARSGKIDRNLPNRFNNMFIFASEPSPMLQFTRSTLENFNNLISNTFLARYARGSTYKCSDTCDYMYFISNCGGPTEIANCPFCGQQIGGMDHQLVQRPGHQNLSHEEALVFLRNSIARQEAQTSKGCKHYRNAGEKIYMRGLKPITSQVLHLILGSSLYGLLKLNLISDRDLRNILPNSDNYENFLSRSIEADLNNIENLLGTNEGHIWLYEVFSHLPWIIEQINREPSEKDVRDYFERLFENEIINGRLSPAAVIMDYKNKLKSDLEFEASFKDYIEELKGPEDENYPMLKFFRHNEEPSFEAMKNAFELEREDKKYGLLRIYFQNYEDIKKVESLYPIIEFTNALLEIYNHNIPREESRLLTIDDAIKESKNENLEALFDSFLKAWETKGLDEMQYGCKALKNIHFNRSSSLNFFLIDNKEHGGGMYMASAILELAEIQNKILLQMNNEISSEKQVASLNIVDPTFYPLQKIKKENLLSLEIDDITIMRICSFNNPGYGMGSEISYDFERLQVNLVKNIIKKKFLDKTKLDLIQYQLELLNMQNEESGLILEIRNSVQQKHFDEETMIKVNYFLRDLEIREKGGVSIKLKEIYGSLNYILCYLKNSKVSPGKVISEFCRETLNTTKISDFFKGRSHLSSIKLENIIALYEKIEQAYFPCMLKFIRAEYKKEDNSENFEQRIIELIQQCDSGNAFPDRHEVQNALLRFIIRCLTADLNEALPIKMYITKTDFWDLDIGFEKIENLGAAFSDEILVSHSVFVFNKIKTINGELDNPREVTIAKAKRNVEKSHKKSSKRMQQIDKNFR